MERPQWRRPHGLAGCVALAALFGPLAALSHAQIGLNAAPYERSDTDEAGPSNFAQPDRKILQLLTHAQKALADHRYGEALEGLTEILRNKEDSFYQPDRNAPIYRSLKTEAMQLLGQMPREGRDLYEVRSGPEARDRLDKALAAGDAAALAEVSGQYFHTQAGYEATYLLALHHMDHGAPLAAALALKRLREAGEAGQSFEPGLSLVQASCYYQAGMRNECQQVLADFKRRSNKPALQIGGREVPWFAQDADAADWLASLGKLERMTSAAEADQWTMFRGEPARNASAPGSAPLLNLRWRVDVMDDKVVFDALRDEYERYHQNGAVVLSGLQPLAINDKVFMRTGTQLLAIDFHTGKRLWPTKPEDLTDETQAERIGIRWAQNNNVSQPVQYGQRIWDDATYGTVSSDGKRIFLIEQLGPNPAPQNVNMGINGPTAAAHGPANRLAAYDLESGKLLWSLGEGGENEGQPDTFFLGPPLPLRGQLYVIAEVKDEIRLLALDPDKGRQIWQQQLTMVESNVSQDPIRRLAGVSPSYADGILVCPTGSGRIVAIDLSTRSLLWGYVCSAPREPAYGGGRWRGFNPALQGYVNGNGSIPRWTDGTAVISGGRVLLTPAETDYLYCLNLADGKPCWQPEARRDEQAGLEHFYIACVHKGLVVFAGRRTADNRALVDAVKLDDGTRAWGGRTIEFPAGVAVSGHGCCCGDRYFLPLTSGEVAVIDLDEGKVVATSKSHENSIPGNLVCYRGRVISQGPDGVELYYQIDAARADSARLLAADPSDPDGLMLRGEIAMDEGRLIDAVADFRRGYTVSETNDKTDAHPRLRELLREALLIGLREKFAQFRDSAKDLEQEKLLDEPAFRSAYYRYMAVGLQRSGEWPQAVEFCLKLADMGERQPPLETVDRSYQARRDRWVQARLAMLRGEGGAAAAAAIDLALDPRLQQAKQEAGVDGLKRFLDFFDGQPQAVSARTELVQRYAQDGRLMEAELLLASAADSNDRKSQAALLAETAVLNLHAAQADEGSSRTARLEDAAACYRLLARDYANVPCGAAATPAAWLSALKDGEALRELIGRPVPTWAKGQVDVSATSNASNINRYVPVSCDMMFVGPAGPFYNDCSVGLEGNQQEVALRDAWGHVKNTLRLQDNNRAIYGGYSNGMPTVGNTCGHLLVMLAGTRIYALDPCRAQATGSKKGVLWIQDTSDATSDNDYSANQMGFGAVFFAGGMQTAGNRVNPFGPVNARVVCFQRIRNIVAVDPFTGEKLWVRKDVPLNSEIFGDEQYVFVLSSNKSEAAVYRATDGEYLGDRKMPHTIPAESASPYGSYNQYYVVNNLERIDNLATTGTVYLGRDVLSWSKGPDGTGRVLSRFDPWLQRPVWPERQFSSGTRVDLVGQEAAAMLEPGGHFILVALSDGHTIADVQLKFKPHFFVSDLRTVRLGDQYIVVAHDTRTAGAQDNEEQMQPPVGMLSHPLRHAMVFAIDLRGKLAWPAPAEVSQQYFLTSQPARLPVLVFGSYHLNNRPNARFNQPTMRTSISALDRRDGRVVCVKEESGQQGGQHGLEVEGDPTDNSVKITANNVETIQLKFTDKPIKEIVRKASGAKKGEKQLGAALLDALEHGVPKGVERNGSKAAEGDDPFGQ